MKIAEIKEMTTSDLVERVEAETANYDQMVINHSISPLENPAQIKQLRILILNIIITSYDKLRCNRKLLSS